MNFSLFLFFSAQIALISCAFNNFENDECSSDFTGDDGICVEAKLCSAFKTNRNQLKICSFRGRVPIVCCPKENKALDRDNTMRISAKKCEEFLQLSQLTTRPSVSKIEDGYTHTFVGGKITQIDEFPHMAAMGWHESSGQIDWRCGGSLISERYVLSAAHCSSLGGVKPQTIKIGARNLNSTSSDNFGIKNIVVHPGYRQTLTYNDLALFELSREVVLSERSKPACLYQSDDDTVTPIEAMGYGQTSFAGPSSNQLLKGFLTLVTNTECNKAYADDKLRLPQGITAMQICAWDPEGNRDTCQGDSGGPLQTTKYSPDSVKYYEIIGVTSFGKYCAAGVPGVYARVYSHLDWIESVVWPSLF